MNILIPWYIDPENWINCKKNSRCYQLESLLCPQEYKKVGCFEDFKANKDNIWDKIVNRANEEIPNLVDPNILKLVENIAEYHNSYFIAICLSIKSHDNSKVFYDWVFGRNTSVISLDISDIDPNTINNQLTREALLNNEFLETLKHRFGESSVNECVNENECGAIFRNIGDKCRQHVIYSDRRYDFLEKDFWISVKQSAEIYSIIDGRNLLIKNCQYTLYSAVDCQVILVDSSHETANLRLQPLVSLDEEFPNRSDGSCLIKEMYDQQEGSSAAVIENLMKSERIPKCYHKIKEVKLVTVGGGAFMLMGGTVTEPVEEVYVRNMSSTDICIYYTGLLIIKELLDAKIIIDRISHKQFVTVRESSRDEICPLIKLEDSQYLNTLENSMQNKYSLGYSETATTYTDSKKILCDYLWIYHHNFSEWAVFDETVEKNVRLRELAHSVLSGIIESNEIDCSELVVHRIRAGTFEDLFMEIVKSSGKDQKVVNMHI
jgi:hypothetical protein